jgi:hypothetical protein
MARARSGQDLVNDVQRRADVEAATDRHPRTDILRYVNQGCAELWDALIEARGPEFFQASSPTSLTTTADTTLYSLASDFYLLIGVRLDGDDGYPLVPFSRQEEPMLRADGGAGKPLFYQLRRTTAGANKIEILPEHDAGLTIKVDYVPEFTDLTDSGSSYFYGINGWEEYVVCFAARCVAVKDANWQLAQALEGEMGRLKQRIMRLAPKRDMHRARRVKDVRGALGGGVGRWGR